MKIGGVDVQNIPLSQVMEHISYVSQDNYLFHLSIRENIRIGRPDATNSEIENAAKKRHAMILSYHFQMATIPLSETAGAIFPAEKSSASPLQEPY